MMKRYTGSTLTAFFECKKAGFFQGRMEMLSNTEAAGSSFLHRADPRGKLLLAVLWVVLALLPVPLYVLSLYYTGLLLLICFSLSPAKLFVPLKTILPILILVLIITPPFHIGGREFFRLGNWYIISTNGLREAATLMLRFTVITNLFFLLFQTTSMDLFILTLRGFGLSYTGALVVTIAFRYIPSLIELYGNIRDAHALRRPSSEKKISWNPLAKLGRIFPSLVSVMVHAIKGIPTLAMALESRGFSRHNPRGRFRELPPADRVLSQLPSFLLTSAVLIGLAFL
jgi:energy-coupling factor transport system permease protein